MRTYMWRMRFMRWAKPEGCKREYACMDATQHDVTIHILERQSARGSHYCHCAAVTSAPAPPEWLLFLL